MHFVHTIASVCSMRTRTRQLRLAHRRGQCSHHRASGMAHQIRRQRLGRGMQREFPMQGLQQLRLVEERRRQQLCLAGCMLVRQKCVQGL